MGQDPGVICLPDLCAELLILNRLVSSRNGIGNMRSAVISAELGDKSSYPSAACPRTSSFPIVVHNSRLSEARSHHARPFRTNSHKFLGTVIVAHERMAHSWNILSVAL